MDVLFGFTPPRLTTAPEKMALAVTRTAERVNRLQPRALVIYDIQDESLRNPNPRPFPFSPTHEPYSYGQRLQEYTDIPLILYKCVVKWQADELAEWLNTVDNDPQVYGVVLVGGQVEEHVTAGVTLDEAYQIFGSRPRRMQLGAVAIAERHAVLKNEHDRMIHKMSQGCQFFISQAVYEPDITGQLITDLTRSCAVHAKPFPPFYMTLTPCGSEKGFEFMDWLGIHVKESSKRFILASQNPVETSVNIVNQMGLDLLTQFPTHPIGFNVESISKRRSEIEASIQLATAMQRAIK